MNALPASRVRSLRARLLLLILPGVALAVIALTAIAVKVASSAQRDAVYGQMSQLIATEAARFDTEARRAQSLAHGLAGAVEADEARDRARGVAVTKRFAVRNPDLLGTWVAFEPNAFGRDAGYVGRGLLGDEDGRFAFWAERLTGKLNLTAFENEPNKPWAKDELLHAAGREGLRRDARALLGLRRDDDQLRGADRARRQARRRRRYRPCAEGPRPPAPSR